MSLRPRALLLAVATEAVLGGLATQGGPHGSLGPWTWGLQLPGLAVLLVAPSERFV